MNADVNKKHRVALMRCTVLFSYGRAGRIAGVTLLGFRREMLRYDGIRHITKREKRVLVIPTNSSRINYEDVAKKNKRGVNCISYLMSKHVDMEKIGILRSLPAKAVACGRENKEHRGFTALEAKEKLDPKSGTKT